MRYSQYIYGLFLMCLITISSCNNIQDSKKIKIQVSTLNEVDGPYIYSIKDSTHVITIEKNIDSTYYIQKEIFKKAANQQFICKVNNKDNDSFSFSLMDEYKVPKTIYELQNKLFITSDIEGNFNAFYSLLVGNNVIDEKFNWTFGDGHLMLAGDMMDRDSNVIPSLWLLYKLEMEAEKHGGKVHYILGNHDVMNMQLSLRYVHPKYLELAKIISEETDDKVAYKYLMSNTNELVKWIKSKNTIEKIGNNLIVHGGISEALTDTGLSLQEINDRLRENINLDTEPENNKYTDLIMGRLGPIWYRGLVKDYDEHYNKIDSNSLDHILQFYNVSHIIVGHTIVDKEVTSDFNGRVIRVDIKHASQKFSGKSQALLIENGNYYRVTDQGEKSKLNMQ